MNVKEERNKSILAMHNEGQSIAQISKATGLSKGGIHKIISSYIITDEPKVKEIIKPILKGNEVKILSFVGLQRIAPNEYINKDTGELIKVAFVKASNPSEYGYFVKV